MRQNDVGEEQTILNNYLAENAVGNYIIYIYIRMGG